MNTRSAVAVAEISEDVHRRLGHIREKGMKVLQSKGKLHGVDSVKLTPLLVTL
jgi:hypothetical protein